MTDWPHNEGTAWSRDDIETLAELIAQNTPTRIIGLKLGRSETSIYQKAAELNLSVKPVNQAPYNRLLR
jgi:hypothetical protein